MKQQHIRVKALEQLLLLLSGGFPLFLTHACVFAHAREVRARSRTCARRARVVRARSRTCARGARMCEHTYMSEEQGKATRQEK